MKIHTHIKSQSNFETYIFEVRYSFQTAKRFESFNSAFGRRQNGCQGGRCSTNKPLIGAYLDNSCIAISSPHLHKIYSQENCI